MKTARHLAASLLEECEHSWGDAIDAIASAIELSDRTEHAKQIAAQLDEVAKSARRYQEGP